MAHILGGIVSELKFRHSRYHWCGGGGSGGGGGGGVVGGSGVCGGGGGGGGGVTSYFFNRENPFQKNSNTPIHCLLAVSTVCGEHKKSRRR